MESSISIDDETFSASQILMTKLSLYEALSNGTGIKGILATGEKHFKNPIFVCDVSYNIIAASPLSKDISYGIKYSKGKAYLDPVEIESMKRFKVIESIYNHISAFKISTLDHPNNTWVFCAIRINRIVSGYVAICYSDIVPTDEDLNLATVIAQVLSLEMQKNDFFMTKTGLKYEYFLTDLLEGQFEDLETVYSRIHILDRKLLKFLCIITVTCDDPTENKLFNKKQMEQLRSIYPESMSLAYKDCIVLLISQNTPFQFGDENQVGLIDFLTRNNVKAGVSQVFTNPLDAAIYYKQSLASLKIGKLLNANETLFFSSQLLMYIMFHNCENSDLKSFVHYHINELQNYDKNYNTELIVTLKAYLKEGRNPTQAANYLHIHRSTFFYRLKKIEELLSISLNDSKILLLYEISFMVQEYMNSTK